ncbi:AraC family transcriptional regulator [Paenibacillus piri]|nr:AraC family transcriptional regulator [Paenibacillus piri]
MEAFTCCSIRTSLIRRHYSGPGKAFMLSEDTYKQWVLMASETGTFHYRIDDRSGVVHVGELVLCPPGLTFYRQTLSPLAFHFVEFSIAISDGQSDLNPNDYMPCGKVTFQNISRIISTFECMRSAPVHYMEHLLDDILFQYLKESAALESDKIPQDEEVQKAVEHIRKHAYEDLSMQHVASLIGLSPSQLTRKFKAELGVSPNVYLTQIRLQKAKTLLTETYASLQQIAEQCGYDNAFYFSRVFSKFVNMSPSQYRKSQQI